QAQGRTQGLQRLAARSRRRLRSHRCFAAGRAHGAAAGESVLMKPQRLCILGSTGSIGRSTLDVACRHADSIRVHALSAHNRMDRLAEQALASGAKVVAVPDEAARARFLAAWPADRAAPEIRLGAHALEACAADPEVDTVMAAIVGAAGLPAALAAARAGKRVLLANKEALVAAGSLFMAAVRDHGAEL